jgi:hypothetical protein
MAKKSCRENPLGLCVILQHAQWALFNICLIIQKQNLFTTSLGTFHKNENVTISNIQLLLCPMNLMTRIPPPQKKNA